MKREQCYLIIMKSIFLIKFCLMRWCLMLAFKSNYCNESNKKDNEIAFFFSFWQNFPQPSSQIFALLILFPLCFLRTVTYSFVLLLGLCFLEMCNRPVIVCHGICGTLPTGIPSSRRSQVHLHVDGYTGLLVL